MKITENKFALVVLIISGSIAVYALYIGLSNNYGSKPENLSQCISDAKTTSSIRISRMCSEKYREKLTCYLSQNSSKCDEQYKEIHFGRCSLQKEMYEIEESNLRQSIFLCEQKYTND
jgi:hypothetical protein